MKHNFKKVLSIVLLVMMCVNSLPLGVFAEEATVVCPVCYTSKHVGKPEVVLTPTCNQAAGTWYTCTYTGEHPNKVIHKWVLQTAPALHSDETKLTHTSAKDATHTADGNIEYWTCNECHKHFKNFPCTEEIAEGEWVVPAATTAHTWGEWQIEKNAVCGGENGLKYRVCTDPACTAPGNRQEEVIYAADHNWVIVTEGLEDISCLVSVEVAYECDNEGCEATKEVDGYGWDHELVETAAKDKTCTEDGNIQYFTCQQCNKIYLDKAATMLVSNASVLVIPASHDADQIFPAVAAGCLIQAKREHCKCDCGVYFYVENDAQIILEGGAADEDIIIGAAHVPTFVPAVASDCTKPGNIEYWSCSICAKSYEGTADAIKIVDGAYVELDSVVDAADGHSMTRHEAVVGGCTAEAGKQVPYIEYWSCSACGNNYDNEAGEGEPITDMRKPITVPDPKGSESTITVEPGSDDYNQYAGVQHNWKCSELEPATCTKSGARAWTCSDCGAFNGFGKTIVYEIPTIDHKDATIIEKKAPTCSVKGTPAYAYCGDCERYLAVEEDGKTIITTYTYTEAYINENVIDSLDFDAANHKNVEIIAAKEEADCFTAGNVAYGYCKEDKCGKFFAVEADGTYTNHETYTTGNQSTELVPADYVVDTHTQTFVELDASENCEDKGYKAHWACSCGKLYAADESGDVVEETAYTDVEEFAYYADHDYGTLVDATYTCGEDGYDAHYQCSVCETYFDVDQVETTWEDLFVEATGEHNTYTDVKMVPCVGENDHGVAGIELCRGCKTYSKTIDQHDYSVKVYVVDPTCTTLGQYKLECSRCGVFQLNEEHEHLVKTEEVARPHSDFGYTSHVAVPSTCVGGLTNGNYAYYECDMCHGKFKNANMTEAYEGDEWIDVAAHSPVEYFTTATECGGSYDVIQYECEVCGLYSMTEDFAVSQETPYTSSIEGHTVPLEVAVKAGASDCTVNGTKEILHCVGECGKFYVDGVEYADLDAAKAAAKLPLIAHDGYDAGFDATCEAEGEIAHYKCTMCGKFFAVKVVEGVNTPGDEITADEIANDALVIGKKDHVGVTFEKENVPHCTDRNTVVEGNIAYYVCSCGKKFATETATPDATPLDDAEILRTHVANHVNDPEKSKAPACEDYGYNFYSCDCGYEYVEFVAPLLHNVTVKNETPVAPSCSESGKLEFYYCENCTKSYSDAACQNELKNAAGEIIDSAEKAVVPATGKHLNAAGDEITAGCDVDADYVCIYGDRCSEYDAETEKADLRIDHDYVAGETAANCTTPASTFDVCKVCGYIKPDSIKSWGEKSGEHPTADGAREWRETTPSTNCHTAAEETEYCKLCGEDTGNKRDGVTLDHDYVHHDADYTCTTAGMKEHYTCSYEGCGKYFDPNKTETTYAALYVVAGEHDMSDFADVPGFEKDYTTDKAEVSKCANCDHEEYRAHQDVMFDISMDNAVVAGETLVNGGKLAVTIKLSAYNKAANAFILKFDYSSNLTFDKVVFADGQIGDSNGSGKNGLCTLMTMNLLGQDVFFGEDHDGVTYAQDMVYATVYFDISTDTLTLSDVDIKNFRVDQMITITPDADGNQKVAADVATTDLNSDVKLLGDVNGDGATTLDLLDAQAMMQLVNKQGYNAQADFNQDGVVTILEFANLRKFLAGVIDYNTLIGAN